MSPKRAVDFDDLKDAWHDASWSKAKGFFAHFLEVAKMKSSLVKFEKFDLSDADRVAAEGSFEACSS